MINENATVRPYSVRFRDCDPQGRIHLYRLMDYAQDCDDRNCALIEARSEDLYDRDAAWILLAQKIQLTGQLPVGEDRLLVESWSMGHEGIRFYRKNRYYRNRADEAHCLGEGLSEWIICSRGNHRPLRPASVLDMALFSQKSGPGEGRLTSMPPLSALGPIEGPFEKLTYRVGYGDLDFNRHLHNTHYVRLAVDTAVRLLGADPSRDKLALKDFHIRFISEIDYLESLEIVARQDPENPETIRLEGRSQASEHPSFLASLAMEVTPGQI